MKEKIFIVVLSLFNVFIAIGQDSLVVKVCTTDCLNCYGNMYKIEKLSDSLPVTLVFPEMSVKERKNYADNLLHIKDITKYNVVTSDSVYRKIQSSTSSEVLVYNNKKRLKKRIELEKFNYKDLHLNDIIAKLPDSVVLSTYVNIDYKNKIFQIVDYHFGQIILLDKNTDKLRIIKSEELTTPLFFELICQSKNSYQLFKKIRKQLRYANFDRVRFVPSNGAINSLVSFIEVPEISFVNDSNVSINPRYGIIEFIDMNNFNVYGIDIKSIPKGYYVTSNAFLHSNDEFYLSLRKKNAEDTTIEDYYFIGRFKKVKNQLFYQEFINWKLPKVYQRKEMEKLAFIPVLTNSYFLIQFSREIYDVKHNTVRFLPLKPNEVDFNINENYKVISNKFSYQIISAKYDKSNLYVLYYNQDKTFHILIVNRKTFERKDDIAIGNIENKRSQVQLLDSNHLCFVSKNNSIVIRTIYY